MVSSVAFWCGIRRHFNCSLIYFHLIFCLILRHIGRIVLVCLVPAVVFSIQFCYFLCVEQTLSHSAYQSHVRMLSLHCHNAGRVRILWQQQQQQERQFPPLRYALCIFRCHLKNIKCSRFAYLLCVRSTLSTLDFCWHFLSSSASLHRPVFSQQSVTQIVSQSVNHTL